MYNNWKMPSKVDIGLEWKLEYVNKHLSDMCDGAFDNVLDFIKAVHAAKVVTVTPAMDRQIHYRSHTQSKEQLVNLLKTYQSWGTFRTMDSVNGLYDALSSGKPMNHPMVLKFSDGSMRVLGGNTRMDVAFQLGINPKVLMIAVK